MTAPRYVDCRCSHSKAHHEMPSLAPQCTGPGCTCLTYRPDVAKPDRRTPAAVTPKVALVRSPTVPVTPPAVAADVTLPAPAPAPGPAAARPSLIEQAKTSPNAATRRLGERIAAMFEDLSKRLEVEHRKAAADAEAEKMRREARARIELLERQLAEAKAAAGAAGRKVIQHGTYACPDCDKTLSTPQGVGAHRARKHGYRRGASS